jgi:biopolymer transport protein TolQ
MQENVIHLILQAGGMVKFVLLLLLFFSVMSWAIIVYKHRALSRAARQSDEFVAAFRSARNAKDAKELVTLAKKFQASPQANVFLAVHAEGSRISRDETRRALKRYATLEAAVLESHLTFLATTGSTTPFIGLFGTVWGIMNAFRGIGAAGSASLAVVAPGIAEALVTTAAGLAAAIPAVMAYNYYLSRTRRMIIEMDDFSEELLEFFSR